MLRCELVVGHRYLYVMPHVRAREDGTVGVDMFDGEQQVMDFARRLRSLYERVLALPYTAPTPGSNPFQARNPLQNSCTPTIRMLAPGWSRAAS